MTYLSVTYRYRGKLNSKLIERLGALRSRYGIVQLQIAEEGNALRVVYDASRLKEADILYQLRLAGVAITGKVELVPAA